MSFFLEAHYSAEFPIAVGVGARGVHFIKFPFISNDLPLHLSLKYLFNIKPHAVV